MDITVLHTSENSVALRWVIDRNSVSSCKYIYSPSFEVGGLAWKVSLYKRENYQCDKRFLTGGLRRVASDVTFESVEVSFTICVVNYASSSANRVGKFDKIFDSELKSWGFNQFLNWKTVTDESKGFINNNTLTVELSFQLTNMKNLSKLPGPNFMDPNNPINDVALIINGEKIFASKSISPVFYSPVFFNLFFGAYKERNNSEVELKSFDKEDILEMLRVLCHYPSKKITDDNVDSLLELADFYQIQKILDKAEKCLTKSVHRSTAAKLVASERFRLKNLQNRCLESMKTVSDIQWLEEKCDDYINISEKLRMEITEMKKKLGG